MKRTPDANISTRYLVAERLARRMNRCSTTVLVLLIILNSFSRLGVCGTNAELLGYFKKNIKLNKKQIAEIDKGKPVTKEMKSRTPADIVVFGAVYIRATPEAYLKLSNDFDRLRKLPIYQGIAKFSNPPELSDLDEFSFSEKDINKLRSCEPGNCKVQLPTQSMEAYQDSIDWDAPNVQERVNQLLRQRTLERLHAYQRDGNPALITYDDKDEPVNTGKQFESILSYAQTLPSELPQFRRYLLAYPNSRPVSTDDMFYWANEKFGLKPTLRVFQVITAQSQSANEPAYAIAEKQLYASHYFQTALNLTFLIRDTDPSTPVGFYLIRAMGSTQAGLTGFKGSMIRRKAVKQADSFLKEWLQDIKNQLEKNGNGSATQCIFPDCPPMYVDGLMH